ncbi:MAG TPA: DNA methyltransferase [Tepidiformaceae bacterium]|nr:DNA methyltransferase [Tepidiformaceae bacterium]
MSATASSWSEAFFDVPEADSIDGGTTSAGPLWHAASTRWGHSMHTMCSYHGMFPAKLAHYFIQRFSRPGDLVVDPFSGRGTVPLQARVEGRLTVANDLSPLAYVLSSAKVNPPSWLEVMGTVDDLERKYRAPKEVPDVSPDIRMLYHSNTMKQLAYIREWLLSEPMLDWAAQKRMVAGALAGIMHGGLRRDGSSQYLSISMPNTFSMSPKYVADFIERENLVPPDQNVFDRIRDKLARLYLDAIDGQPGTTYAQDASELLAFGTVRPASVNLLVTSPPYLQVVNYGASNWLFGIDEVSRDRGEGRKRLDRVLDHGHRYDAYRGFMKKLFVGVERSLAPNGVAALVIGDVIEPGKDRVPLAEQMWDELGSETSLELVQLIEDQLPVDKKVSRIWGESKGQATDKDCVLVLKRKGAGIFDGGSDVDWDEPYKDGGPDAAHARLRRNR